MYYMTKYPSPVGMITLACDGDNLVGLWLDGQKYYGGSISDSMTEKNDLPIFDTVKSWLDNYFNGNKPLISELPLKPIGTEFRQKVWSVLCDIPYGEVITYGDIAKKLNTPNMSAQAVGGAVGHNPISIIIPCHRVVGSNGSLTGYAGGIDTKIKLLELERVDTSQFKVPKKGTAL
jgi:O-6-methylguanine DNA methyltransferase